MDLDLDDLFDDAPTKDKKSEETAESDDEPAKKTASHRAGKRQLTRKAASEQALEEALDWYFQEGDCYHCFSFGDVDSMSYFKHVLKQQKVKYLAISTWCMAGADVEDLEKWYDRGYIGRVDFYVGEIFPGSYPEVYEMTKAFCRKCGGRLVIFRNHSKIMIVKGEKFDCLIESSANVNTNPRSENTVLTVDKGLVSDYIELFAGIKSFNREFDDVEPYTESEATNNGGSNVSNKRPRKAASRTPTDKHRRRKGDSGDG